MDFYEVTRGGALTWQSPNLNSISNRESKTKPYICWADILNCYNLYLDDLNVKEFYVRSIGQRLIDFWVFIFSLERSSG